MVSCLALAFERVEIACSERAEASWSVSAPVRISSVCALFVEIW